MKHFNPDDQTKSKPIPNHPNQSPILSPTLIASNKPRTPPTYPFLAYAIVKERKQNEPYPRHAGQNVVVALLSTIPMQIEEGIARDEPKQEKPSVSIDRDVSPGRVCVKRVFCPMIRKLGHQTPNRTVSSAQSKTVLLCAVVSRRSGVAMSHRAHCFEASIVYADSARRSPAKAEVTMRAAVFPVHQPPRFLRSISCSSMGVKISCIASGILPPGQTIPRIAVPRPLKAGIKPGYTSTGGS